VFLLVFFCKNQNDVLSQKMMEAPLNEPQVIWTHETFGCAMGWWASFSNPSAIQKIVHGGLFDF
jgi:hypothetical protein